MIPTVTHLRKVAERLRNISPHILLETEGLELPERIHHHLRTIHAEVGPVSAKSRSSLTSKPSRSSSNRPAVTKSRSLHERYGGSVESVDGAPTRTLVEGSKELKLPTARSSSFHAGPGGMEDNASHMFLRFAETCGYFCEFCMEPACKAEEGEGSAAHRALETFRCQGRAPPCPACLIAASFLPCLA
jgi:hypothetical protein